jgi:Icc-related predicted phosphoesterase
MKIVATSDFHGSLPQIPECDLLLIGGDICPIEGSHKPASQRSWLRKTFAPWLEEQPAKEIVWILGNHDFVGELPGFNRIAEELPGVYLKDSSTVFFDYRSQKPFKIYGFPWTPNLKHWAFYKSDNDWRAINSQIPDDADIILMHAPPRGVGGVDGGHPEWCAPHIYERLAFVSPKLIVFGHIHEGYGERKIGEVQLANVAHMNDFYEPVNAPMVFEL